MLTAQEIKGHDMTRPARTDYIVALGFVGVLGTWFAWLLGLGKHVSLRFADTSSDTKMAVVGQFGDMFGSINALFTALAFVTIWWTGRMQRRELELQRQELAYQRDAIDLQRKEMTGTRLVIARQTFESMFFQCCDSLANCVSSAPKVKTTGRPTSTALYA